MPRGRIVRQPPSVVLSCRYAADWKRPISKWDRLQWKLPALTGEGCAKPVSTSVRVGCKSANGVTLWAGRHLMASEVARK
jgi:hypothetical protein